ncbi:ABC transporter permease [Quadrisphaera oryzae]|uniref:ABC transporter permease n=1 Tax=Quadrisphaera TaxID=317661 RepID=UPI0016475B54|nr:ABC transporter permease [Quadrisphaera sp. RL12-1S]MBC3763841.1 ABC transporter permease [Quadrisphaera sp. RL12-1S]
MTTTSAAGAATAAPAPPDERLRRTSRARALLGRPELGAAVGAAAVLVFFLYTAPSFRTGAGVANFLDAASLLGIMAVGVALLMVGGEFDLSAGVQTASSALFATIVAYQLTLNAWVGVGLALVFSLAVGAANGLVLVKTRLPSFIVTLGTFFVLQGVNLAVTKLITGTVLATGIGTLDGWDSVRTVFAGSVTVGSVGIKASVLWWALLVVLGTLLLTRTRVGNWIYASGGGQSAARQTGVPVARVKVLLFMTVSLCGWLVGMIVMSRSGSVQANLGIGLEFEYIIAAVIGGCLLTGGFGSVIGAALGALIFGMTKQGIPAAQWDNDWYKLFLGVMLLAATLLNSWVRRRATGERD